MRRLLIFECIRFNFCRKKTLIKSLLEGSFWIRSISFVACICSIISGSRMHSHSLNKHVQAFHWCLNQWFFDYNLIDVIPWRCFNIQCWKQYWNMRRSWGDVMLNPTNHSIVKTVFRNLSGGKMFFLIFIACWGSIY